LYKLWHHRLNGKAGQGGNISFYRLVPLLRKEAEICRMSVAASDLDRELNTRYSQLDDKLHDLWDLLDSKQ
jgi:hypothetical protein